MAKDNSIILLGGAALALMAFSSSAHSSPGGSSPDHQGGSSSVPKTPTDFIKKHYWDARSSMYKTGVPELVTLAQAGLESNWGKAAYGNNFFGIKASKSWDGKIQKLRTWECGKTNDEIINIYKYGSPGSNPNCNTAHKDSYRVYGKFRAYERPLDGFIDHGKFLLENHRYKDAFKYKNNPEQFAWEVANAGYATAPNYGRTLADTIRNIRKVIPNTLATEDKHW